MRRHVLLALVVVLALSGCSSDDPRSLGPVPTAPTTTTAAPAPTSTTVVATTTTTTAGPRLVNGIPQVTATPARAAIGATVRVEGTGFTDEMWRAPSPTLWLADKSGCNLYAQAPHSITVTAAGRLTGEFTVPAAGACRMSDVGVRPVVAGSYRIVFTCTACAIGDLDVTTSASLCADIAFSPNSDNLASGIVAAGVPCAEAEALVRQVGAQVGATGGPSRVEADGWICVRSASRVTFTPSSDFACTSGTKTVSFRRT